MLSLRPSAQLIDRFFVNSRIWFLIFVISLIYASLIPPLQSPDEPAHLARIYLLSKGVVGFTTLQGVGSGGYIDTGLLEFIQLYSDLPFNRRKKLDTTMLQQSQLIQWSKTEEFAPVFSAASFPAIYLPGALGMWLGRTLDLLVYNSYFLTRLFTMLASLGILVVSLSLHPPNFLTLLILLLPMSLFQFTTVNADGLSYALSMLIIALTIHGVNHELPYRPWMFLILAIAVLILVSTKWQFAPIVLVLPLIGVVRRDKRHFFAAVILLAGLALWAYYVLLNYADSRIVREIDTRTVSLYYLSHPQQVIHIFWNTLSHERLLRSYDIASLVFVAIAACTLSLKEISNDYPFRLTFLLISITSLLFTFLALLIAWSPFPTNVVKGVQGRYFTIPLLFFSYVLSGLKPRYSFGVRLLVYCVFLAFIAISCLFMTRLIMLRYLVQ